MANDNRNHAPPGKGAKVDRKPLHGVDNPFGETVPYGYHDGTEPIHAPKDDDDREPSPLYSSRREDVVANVA